MRDKLPIFLMIVLSVMAFIHVEAQEDESWFYFRARDTVFNPSFEQRGDFLVYMGSDVTLKQVLEKYNIKMFKKTWRNAKKENLKKTFFVIDR